ncbi:MAG: diacylglycerol kinase family lipid kinase [Clostridium sp.]|nr:diacylglycerol kinase family lipid kinase [Clostridium sp.]
MYYIIVNPASKSGRGAKIWSMIEPILDRRDIEYKVFFSAGTGHVVKLVRDLSDTFFTRNSEGILSFIILGGDGTLNETLQGISNFDRVQIGYIPTGSSNDMARDLMLPADPLETLERILSCEKPTLMDIGCLVYEQTSQQLSRQHEEELRTKRYFAVSSGIGFDAAVCEEALTSKFKKALNKIGLGKLTYLIIALKQLIKAKKITCTITLNDEKVISIPKFLFVAGMIHQYEGGGFKFCPDANPSDGIIDICAVGNIPKWLILMALPTAFKGNHYRFNGIDRYSASKVHLETSAPLWVHTDGEVSLKSSSITLTCEKEKLRLLL